MEKDRLRFVRNTWINSNGTMHLGIPIPIIEKMKMNQNDFLLIELVDDSIIAIKKINPQLSKTEINKVTSHENKTVVENDASITVDEEDTSTRLEQKEEEFDNPLKGLNL
ncbi:hypothetical protein [Nitrosopumilus sp.]|uniref:hypothetical protein n=1 Tax=Nitrosopumilus sp. TaxID=2024843 RepID=UPI00292FE943|nr:hypothetical protein [Nitrosopumilus sp.]